MQANRTPQLLRPRASTNLLLHSQHMASILWPKVATPVPATPFSAFWASEKIKGKKAGLPLPFKGTSRKSHMTIQLHAIGWNLDKWPPLLTRVPYSDEECAS